MKITNFFLLAASAALSGCSSMADIEIALRGSDRQNRSEAGDGNVVSVRIYRLKGEPAKEAFLRASFSQLWSQNSAEGMALDGDVLSLDVVPSDSLLATSGEGLPVLKGVPPEVTHIGVLAMFRNCKPPEHRIVLSKDEADDLEVFVEVDGSVNKLNTRER
jgi:type VI secretion system VasD/TssJ family lipoprotein